jgi:LPXTG-motif cell wall-anchored protein
MDTTDVVFLILGVAVVLGVGGFLFLRFRRTKEEPMYHFRCPGCRRRLRYRQRQVGHQGGCSNCGQHITFPAISDSID